jgi:hypothetical protein
MAAAGGPGGRGTNGTMRDPAAGQRSARQPRADWAPTDGQDRSARGRTGRRRQGRTAYLLKRRRSCARASKSRPRFLAHSTHSCNRRRRRRRRRRRDASEVSNIEIASGHLTLGFDGDSKRAGAATGVTATRASLTRRTGASSSSSPVLRAGKSLLPPPCRTAAAAAQVTLTSHFYVRTARGQRK